MAHHIRHLDAGEGTRLHTIDSIATVKVAGADTGDEYELFELDAPAGSGIPPHRHPWAEAYYVLSGALTVQVGARHLDLGPGASVTIPPNAAHTFTVTAPETKILVFSMTAASGHLFADLDRTVPSDRPIDEVIPLVLEVAARNGVEFVRTAQPASGR
jgi:quercetin dioxygenase-like cupin family protein